MVAKKLQSAIKQGRANGYLGSAAAWRSTEVSAHIRPGDGVLLLPPRMYDRPTEYTTCPQVIYWKIHEIIQRCSRLLRDTHSPVSSRPEMNHFNMSRVPLRNCVLSHLPRVYVRAVPFISLSN